MVPLVQHGYGVMDSDLLHAQYLIILWEHNTVQHSNIQCMHSV